MKIGHVCIVSRDFQRQPKRTLLSPLEKALHDQESALKKAGCYKVFSAVVTDVRMARAAFEETAKHLKGKDTLVVCQLGQLTQSLPQLLALQSRLEKKGVYLQSLSEKMDTRTPFGALIFKVFQELVGVVGTFHPVGASVPVFEDTDRHRPLSQALHHVVQALLSLNTAKPP